MSHARIRFFLDDAMLDKIERVRLIIKYAAHGCGIGTFAGLLVGGTYMLNDLNMSMTGYSRYLNIHAPFYSCKIEGYTYRVTCDSPIMVTQLDRQARDAGLYAREADGHRLEVGVGLTLFGVFAGLLAGLRIGYNMPLDRDYAPAPR